MESALDRGVSDDQNDQIFCFCNVHRAGFHRIFASHGCADAQRHRDRYPD